MPQKVRRESIAALALYLAISVIFFGLPILLDLPQSFIGDGLSPRGYADATAMMWFLAWWPHALLNRLNPFMTTAVWAPKGVNLAWTTCIPGVSLLASPITLTLGPVVAYNVASLLAPALSAWTAYKLCRYITAAGWPSLVAGYIFGFSTYELFHLPGHLSLTPVFILPLFVYLVLLRLNDQIRSRNFVLLLGFALAFQFLISNEVFASTTVFGFLSLLVALVIFPTPVKKRLLSVCALIGYAYALAALVLSPYLYYCFADGFPRNPINDPVLHSSDLLNFFIPTGITFLGGREFVPIWGLFTGESTAYVGLPLLLIVLIYTYAHWREPLAKFLAATFVLFCLGSLGPELHIAGTPAFSLPWKIAVSLPILNHALPARFTVYAFLDIAIITSLWLSSEAGSRRMKNALVLVGILFLLPNVPDSYTRSSSRWKTRIETPAFFSQGLYRNYLGAGEIIISLPYGNEGYSMLWQAQSKMYFRMAGGYVNSTLPSYYRGVRAVRILYSNTPVLAHVEVPIRTFLSENHVGAIILADGAQQPWGQVFSKMGLVSTKVGEVTLYQVPESAPVP